GPATGRVGAGAGRSPAAGDGASGPRGARGRSRARASSRLDLVIFDCDGVLVDSERLSIRLDAELLSQLGWPLDEQEIVDRWVGRTEAAMRALIEEHLGRDGGPGWDVFAERY